MGTRDSFYAVKWPGNEADYSYLFCTKIENIWRQVCTNPKYQITLATEFCMTALDVCGSSVQNTHYGISLAPKILRWLLDFWKIGAPLFEAILTFTHVLIVGFLKKHRDFHLLSDMPCP